jgi:hypothetical protein
MKSPVNESSECGSAPHQGCSHAAGGGQRLGALLGLLVVAVEVLHSLRILPPWRQSMALHAVTSNPPAVIQTLIDAHINGFNTQDNNLFLSVFGDTAIIIDGIGPIAA